MVEYYRGTRVSIPDPEPEHDPIEDRSLIDAIRDDPFNQELRLIYSDWLEENGNPEAAAWHRNLGLADPNTLRSLVHGTR